MKTYQSKLLDDFGVFLDVIHLNSFAACARQYGLSRAQISKRIQSLEKKLGVTLLIRSTRSMMLTSAGEALYKQLNPLYQEMIENCQSICESASQMSGSIRINAPFSFGLSHLIPCIHDFYRHYPEIHIDLVLGSFYQKALAGSFDVAIVIKDQFLPKVKHTLISTRSTQICAAPEYLKQQTTPKEPQDLTKHNCLIYANPGETRNIWHFKHNNKNLKVQVHGKFTVNSSVAVLQAAIDGMGIAKLPGYLGGEYIKNKKLVSLLADYCPRDIGMYAIFPSNTHILQRTSLLVDFLKHFFKDKAAWN